MDAEEVQTEGASANKPSAGPRRMEVPLTPALPKGKQVGSEIPVTKNCSMSVMATGEVTQEGLEKLIQYINLIKGSFPQTGDTIQ